MKVLYVDDNLEDQELISRFFSTDHDANSTIVAATNGEECLELLQQVANVDCVLLDYSLPGVDGLQLLNQIKSTYPDLPVVILTGNGDEDLAVQAMISGASYYLPKNKLTKSSLVHTLERAVLTKQTELELRASRTQLENMQRLETVGHLAAAISHELNNVLATARYSLELFHNGESDQAQVIGSLNSAFDSAEEVASRLAAVSGQANLVAETRNLTEVFQDLQLAVLAQFGTDAVVEYKGLSSQHSVYCDQRQLCSVIVALVRNAIEAADKNGRPKRVVVIADTQDDSKAALPQSITFSVKDEAGGMTQSDLKQCIYPFYTTKPASPGAGLGLALAAAFAKENGGKLAVNSQFEDGTTVSLSLPNSPAHLDRPEILTEPEPIDTKEFPTLLVVEDEDLQRKVLTTLLRKAGYRVIEATDPANAMATIGDKNVDLLLTDIQMPGENGFAFAERFRKLRPNVPIVYMTAFATKPSDGEQKLLGPIMQKPLDLSALESLIRNGSL